MYKLNHDNVITNYDKFLTNFDRYYKISTSITNYDRIDYGGRGKACISAKIFNFVDSVRFVHFRLQGHGVKPRMTNNL